MEMISQQTIREQVRHRRQILLAEIEEMFVISCFNKDILVVDAAIVDMVIGVVEKGGRAGHLFYHSDLKGLRDP